MRKQKRKFGYNSKRCFEALTINGVTEVFPEILKAKYGLTNDEILFLRGLLILKDNELLPVRVNGIKKDENVLAPPISVAVFDYYYGAEMSKKDGIFAILGMLNNAYHYSEVEMKMNLSKSIFKKVSPELYSRCF